MAKIPYFRFFPDDWLSSPKVMVDMDDAERGIYITLLAVAWHLPDCTLPASLEKCRRLCRAKRIAKVEKVLRACFTLTENGWRNDRELIENRHASETHHKAVLAGKASANKRLHQTSVEQPLQRSFNQPEPEPEESKYIGIKPPEPKPLKAPFIIPTLEEVTAFCKERNNGVNPEKFIAHYTNTGWRVGRAPGRPMRNWKAAIISTWERDNPPCQTTKNREGFA